MKLYFIVLGSSIDTWRAERSSGNTLAEGWSEPFLQKAGLFDAAHGRRKPHPALLVEHAIVVVGPLAPDLLLAPVGRGRRRLRGGGGMERRSERFRPCSDPQPAS